MGAKNNYKWDWRFLGHALQSKNVEISAYLPKTTLYDWLSSNSTYCTSRVALEIILYE